MKWTEKKKKDFNSVWLKFPFCGSTLWRLNGGKVTGFSPVCYVRLLTVCPAAARRRTRTTSIRTRRRRARESAGRLTTCERGEAGTGEAWARDVQCVQSKHSLSYNYNCKENRAYCSSLRHLIDYCNLSFRGSQCSNPLANCTICLASVNWASRGTMLRTYTGMSCN